MALEKIRYYFTRDSCRVLFKSIIFILSWFCFLLRSSVKGLRSASLSASPLIFVSNFGNLLFSQFHHFISLTSDLCTAQSDRSVDDWEVSTLNPDMVWNIPWFNKFFKLFHIFPHFIHLPYISNDTISNVTGRCANQPSRDHSNHMASHQVIIFDDLSY